MDERWIELEGVLNARTLDGLPCADGKRVRPGLLLRTGKLVRATDGDVAALAERWRVSLVIDLRTTMERQQEPDRAIPGAERREIPVFSASSSCERFFDIRMLCSFSPNSIIVSKLRIMRNLRLHTNPPSDQSQRERMYRMRCASRMSEYMV